MAETLPYGTKNQRHRFNPNQPGTVIVEDLPRRDLLSLIGPGGLTSLVPLIERGKATVQRIYAVEGMTAVDIPSDSESSIAIGVTNEEAAGLVMQWIQKSLDATYVAREKNEEVLKAPMIHRRDT